MRVSADHLRIHQLQNAPVTPSPAILAVIAVPLLVPVILFSAARFEVSLTLLLAPLAGLSLLRAPALLRNLFLGCVIAGGISIVLSTVFLGDSLQPRYVLSLLLIMTPPLYFFLGSYLCARHVNFPRLVEALGLVSTMFVLALATKAIATGSQVRWYIGAAGYTVLNVDFLGLPLYGSFGVLSLASLLVLQLFVVGAAFIASTARWRQLLLLIGFAGAVFLITGSNARGPQLALPFLFVILSVAALFKRSGIQSRAAALLTVGVIAAVYSSARMIEPLRLVATARQLAGLPPAYSKSDRAVETARQPATTGRPGEADAEPIDYESLSTGRESLLQDSLREVSSSPIVGNGFASFGRIDRAIALRSARVGNRTTHVQYLTILWKGGVVFFIPYMGLLAAYWLRAIRGMQAARSPEGILVCAGLLFLFTILSLTWDILLVPSAGALGFFLLGALGEGGGGTVPQVDGP